MANITHSNSILYKELFKPLFDLLEGAKQRRECCVLDDSLWLEVGIRRCLNIFQSGRDLIQYLAEQHNTEILVSTFFESLKSKRRLGLLDELLSLMQPYMRRNLPDAFKHYACLEDFELYAGDGHFIAAACHDKASEPSSKEHGSSNQRCSVTKHATGHLYALNLRNHAMSHLNQLRRASSSKMIPNRRRHRNNFPLHRKRAQEIEYCYRRITA